MRLKSININERSSTFSNEQKKSLKDMSDSINQVGEVFDNMVQLESFVLNEIQDELSELLGVKENKQKIVQENGLQEYLEKYFTPAVYKIEDKLNKTIEKWDNANDKLSIQELKDTIKVFKELSILLKSFNSDFKSVKLLQELIDEFGYFQLAKAIFTGDIVDRMNILTKLKQEIKQTFDNQSHVQDIDSFKKKRKRLTIDDL